MPSEISRSFYRSDGHLSIMKPFKDGFSGLHQLLNSGYKKERNLFKVKGMEKILILQEPVIAK